MADYEGQIRSEFDQLTSLGQYRNLLIETLNQADYPGLEDRIRSEFNFDHLNNPKILADFLADLFSPHELVSRELRSEAGVKDGTRLLESLLVINRTRNLTPEGNFDDAGEWTLEAGWAISGGTLNGTATPNDAISQTTITSVAGATYYGEFDITARTSGAVFLKEAGSGVRIGPVAFAVGKVIGTIRANDATIVVALDGIGDSPFTGSIDNVKLRQLEA